MEHVETFDTLAGALNRIDTLRASKQVAYLGHEIIEATHDKYGRMEDILCSWLVKRRKVNPLASINPVAVSDSNPMTATLMGVN